MHARSAGIKWRFKFVHREAEIFNMFLQVVTLKFCVKCQHVTQQTQQRKPDILLDIESNQQINCCNKEFNSQVFYPSPWQKKNIIEQYEILCKARGITKRNALFLKRSRQVSIIQQEPWAEFQQLGIRLINMTSKDGPF